MRYNEAQYNTYSHDHKIDYEPTVIKIVYIREVVLGLTRGCSLIVLRTDPHCVGSEKLILC